MRIHKEGTLTIALVFSLLAILQWSCWMLFPSASVFLALIGLLSLAFFIFILRFFRNPVRLTPPNDHRIICPADGKVVVIEKTVETEYFKDERLQISVFMSPLNVHVNRNIISGIIRYVKYHPGKYLVAWHPKSSTENERNTVVYMNDASQEFLVRQIAGKLARKIVCYAKPGQVVKQGEDFGFIKFGSRVDIFLPPDTQVDVSLNQVVQGGITVLARI